MKKSIVFCAATLMALLFSANCASAKIQISKGGKAVAKIVLPDDANVGETYAAAQLKAHLDKISGANFEILKESQAKDSGATIQIGDTKKARKTLKGFDAQKAPYDSIKIKTEGDTLFLSGHKKRGAFYAAVEFLESLGVRQWSGSESHIPKNPDIVAEDADFTFAPKLVSRRSSYLDPIRNPDFAAFSRVTLPRFKDMEMREKFGDVMSIGCHSFYRIIPPKKYFAEHPEWFSYNAKKKTRFHEHGQLCLTNEEMFKEFVSEVLKIIESHPNAKYVHISQNDWQGYCECEKCRAFEASHGGVPSATNIYFANKVAEEIEKKYPEIGLITFAYQYTRKAPKNIAPRRNVYVELCSIECDFAHPLKDDEEFGFTKDLKDWGKLTRNLFIWNYATCFWNYMLPHPNMTSLADDIKFFSENGAAGIFEQGDSQCNVGNFCHLRYWIISRLLWNGELDQKELEREFLSGYYGEEIGAMFGRYLKIINDCGAKTNYAQHCYYVDTFTWLDVKSFDKCAGIMADALDAAKRLEKKDPKKYAGLVDKVEREKIGIDLAALHNYAQIVRLAKEANYKLKNLSDPELLAKSLNERFAKFKVPTWREMANYKMFQEYKKRLENAAKSQKSYILNYPEKSGDGDLKQLFAQTPFKCFQEDFINQTNPPKPVRIDPVPCDFVADKSASNGYAAKLSENCEDGRFFSIPLRDTLHNLYKAKGEKSKDAKFKVCVWIRSDVKLPKKTWLIGTVRNQSRGTRHIGTKNVANVFAKEYQKVEIGTFTIENIDREKKNLRTFMLTLLPKNLDKHDAILVDRVAVSIE